MPSIARACLKSVLDYAFARVKNKYALPVALMVAFAITRWPGMYPQNFSAAYALLFCAGVYFVGRTAWWLPLLTMFISDVALNLYYRLALDIDVFNPAMLRYMLGNYGVYIALIWLGRRFTPRASFSALLGGGVLGALMFYLLTNTFAWFFNPFSNPEYTRTLGGWLIALTKGTAGWPETWEFFRNTLLSGGLFTGLFVGAMKASEAMDEAKEPETETEPDGEEAKPDEAKA